MLFTATDILGYSLYANDGQIGSVKDLIFDDHYWAIRYLLADSGTLFPGRKVLIAPHALLNVDKNQHQVHVELSREQIENSPALVSDTPISRQFEQRYFGYFGWAPYWGGPYMWGYSPFIFATPGEPAEQTEPIEDDRIADPDLHTVRDVTGYHLQAPDGELGHVTGFVVDDEVWAIRYLVVDTGTWLPGKKVIIAPSWVDGVSWSEQEVYVRPSRQQVQDAPEFNGIEQLTRGYEAELYSYYGQDGYWASDQVSKAKMI